MITEYNQQVKNVFEQLCKVVCKKYNYDIPIIDWVYNEFGKIDILRSTDQYNSIIYWCKIDMDCYQLTKQIIDFLIEDYDINNVFIDEDTTLFRTFIEEFMEDIENNNAYSRIEKIYKKCVEYKHKFPDCVGFKVFAYDSALLQDSNRHHDYAGFSIILYMIDCGYHLKNKDFEEFEDPFGYTVRCDELKPLLTSYVLK